MYSSLEHLYHAIPGSLFGKWSFHLQGGFCLLSVLALANWAPDNSGFLSNQPTRHRAGAA